VDRADLPDGIEQDVIRAGIVRSGGDVVVGTKLDRLGPTMRKIIIAASILVQAPLL
jgi:hypothetical protein